MQDFMKLLRAVPLSACDFASTLHDFILARCAVCLAEGAFLGASAAIAPPENAKPTDKIAAEINILDAFMMFSLVVFS